MTPERKVDPISVEKRRVKILYGRDGRVSTSDQVSTYRC